MCELLMCLVFCSSRLIVPVAALTHDVALHAPQVAEEASATAEAYNKKTNMG